jgi:hypothetical protein
MTQIFSLCSATEKARVRFQARPCGRRNDTGTGLLQILLFAPVTLILPMLHSYIHSTTVDGT